MRPKTSCRPPSHLHHSQVDRVRRNAPPAYARSASWDHWTVLGGVTWALTGLWIAMQLVLYGATTGGYAPVPHRGVFVNTSRPGLTGSDVEHLRAGGAIADGTGVILIDPAVDDLVFVSVSADGRREERRRTRSRPDAPSPVRSS